jgi:hypothetical protein
MFHFTIRALISILLPVFFVGCEPQSPPPTPAPQGPPTPPGTPGAGSTATLSGAEVWNQSQVEQFLKDELAITSSTLKSTGSGYQGTGTDVNGIAYTFTIKQVSGGIKVEWATSTSNGMITFGNPVP